MKLSPCRSDAGRFAALLLLATSPLLAQTAPPAASPADNEKAITLEAFTVTSQKDTGYRATTSISATGIGTKIMDTPIPISVITAEFISDTAGSEMREALQFVPGVSTTPRNEAAFVIRGFDGNIAYRNGQYRRQNYTSWNMDRVEVIKGSAAVFFGTVRPGGLVNYTSTKPVFGDTFTDVQVKVGGEDHYRGGVFHNQPLGEKVAIRLGVGGLDMGGKAAFDYRRETYLGGSLIWKLTENQQLTIDLETVHRNNFMRSSRGYAYTHTGYLFNPAVPANQTVRQWLDSQGRQSEPTFDTFAPIYPANDPYGQYFAYSADSFEKFVSRTVDLEYLLKLGKDIVFLSQLNYGFDDQPGLRSNNGDQEPLANGTVNMRFEQYQNTRDSFNAKNRVTWRFDLGATSHTLQVAHEYQRVIFNKPGFFDSANRYNGSLLSAVFNFNPRSDPLPSGLGRIAAANQAYNITRKIIEVNQGVFIVNQSRFFNERLHLLYGARYNMLDREVSYTRPVVNPDTGLGSPRGWTPQLGGVYKPRQDLSFFAVYSESIEPNFAVDADGNTAEAIEGKGYDIGVKSELFNGRLAGTMTYYTIDRANLAARDTAKEIATGRTPYYFYGNTNTSTGVELDLNWSPTKNYSLVFGWAHFLKSEITKSTTPGRVGLPLSYTPEDTVTLWNRYVFTEGPLKGFTIGGGLRHAVAARISGDVNRVMIAPAFTVYDVMISHKFEVGGREVRAQLNVKNLFDKAYREGTEGQFAPERTWQLGLSTRF
jgi:iron complex outermembrane receptor protein